MRTSDAGIYALVLHEGIVPAPYLDSVGVWTFGIGHAETSGLAPNPRMMPKGMPADLDAALAEAFLVFRADLPKYEAAVNRALKVPVTQPQFDALVSFHFNTGAIATASFVKKLNAGDVAGAAKGMMAWRKPAAIIDRRKAEQALFAVGAYPSGMVNVWRVSPAGKVIWKPVKRLTMAQVLHMLRPATKAPAVAPSSPAPVSAPAKPGKAPVGPALVAGGVLAVIYAAWETLVAWVDAAMRAVGL